MSSPALQGVIRSLRIYHGPHAPRDAMDQLYRLFVEPGALVFDIGAHVGDRISSFRRLGARVIAVEPQPLLFSALNHIHGRDPLVELLDRAVGSDAGVRELFVNTTNPTVSTLSEEFVNQARGARGWEDQIWDGRVPIEIVTLDGLIARYGTPSFIKIDVEGYEDAALRGLSQPVKALSFEFTTIARYVAMACFDRLSALGRYRYNLALGESQKLLFDVWMSDEEMAGHLSNLPHEANSGDVYATLALD
ncbi:FkbM family methyltransferase [Hyphomicrobium sp.]|uniref:FkbM family methyltransferase n=1 Tax=Hyphomicrobium sp. TaxID=82 RepID=UPI000F9ACFEB|nr:FkbM family methyltransferase [Hyphomicrobium sp.]RUO98041.1 MAG: FkbM family methyltransferase [Hyphomicrobium sp.]